MNNRVGLAVEGDSDAGHFSPVDQRCMLSGKAQGCHEGSHEGASAVRMDAIGARVIASRRHRVVVAERELGLLLVVACAMHTAQHLSGHGGAYANLVCAILPSSGFRAAHRGFDMLGYQISNLSSN